jgi:glyceraldehyde 3-phosphate dehydrogenase
MAMQKLAINGFGRIGRRVLVAALKKSDELEVVAINDLTSPETLAHLLKYDSVHGRFDGDVSVEAGKLIVNGKAITLTAERNPAELPWKELGVETVLECTGLFLSQEKAGMHIKAGAKRVLLSAPGKGDIDLTVVMGVNHEQYNPEKHFIISNASCTTNCLAPVAKVLNDSFGIKNGLMTTVHAYTANQAVLDMPHKDARRGRACAVSMIPTTTGAAKAVTLVLPELEGKLDGMAVRVPTPNVSLVDLTVTVDKATTAEEVNAAMKAAAEGPLKGILDYVEEPLVSVDFVGDAHSSSFDAALTKVQDGNLIKILSWYDNEFGYSSRLVDLACYIGSK